MPERYSEKAIYDRIHQVPLSERLEMISAILETIDQTAIETRRTSDERLVEMRGSLRVDGLDFIWRAWKISRVRTVDYLMDGGLERYETDWWSHAPYHPDINPKNKQLQSRYKKYLARYYSDPITRGGFSTAVILACAMKEEEVL